MTTWVAGIDVGSQSTDAVVLAPGGAVAAFCIVATGAHSGRAAAQALEEALAAAGIDRGDLAAVVATGYGRGALPCAARTVTEITCHAAGAAHLFPGVGTVIDIGGQDSKVIRLEPGGRVVDFTMNDKCAAGTGRFLEVMAAKLQIPLEQMGELSLGARGSVQISSLCTVFAESEVISLVARDHPVDQILRGLHQAIVNRIWSLAKGLGIQGEVVMTGGVAKNRGVVALLEEKLGRPIRVHSEPQIVGALGAALQALRPGKPREHAAT